MHARVMIDETARAQAFKQRMMYLTVMPSAAYTVLATCFRAWPHADAVRGERDRWLERYAAALRRKYPHWKVRHPRRILCVANQLIATLRRTTNSFP